MLDGVCGSMLSLGGQGIFGLVDVVKVKMFGRAGLVVCAEE